MSKEPIQRPSSGGCYVRKADGSLEQTAASTAPAPGKTPSNRKVNATGPAAKPSKKRGEQS